ncbi:hypothetical protein GF415_05165 [Candidatus Micrarchaeota archaeon]|nr:hypothetical protein [Candidatus Micrarchaeota archaeon]
MKCLLLFFLLLSPLFSFPAGEALVYVQKNWTITSEDTARDLFLNGSFLLENTYQEIIWMETAGGAELVSSNGSVRLFYSEEEFSGKKTVSASALVKSIYPITTPSSPPLNPSPAPAHGLIAYDSQMQEFAHSFTEEMETELEAASSLADWTYEYVNYNHSHWGSPSPAKEVFHNPEAMCVGYTHLYISLLRSLGFETRFVSGYAYSEKWQPHTWAEARIGNRWIPFDPTFRESLSLDARHIATRYTDDQEGSMETLSARGAKINFSSSTRLTTSEELSFSETLFIHSVFSNDSLRITVYNPTDAYSTPTYSFTMPGELIQQDTRILFIPPKSSVNLEYNVDTSALQPGYTHSIPYEVTVQGTHLSEQRSVVVPDEEKTAEAPIPVSLDQGSCFIAFALLLPFLFSKRK